MSVRSKLNREIEAPAEAEHAGRDLPERWAASALGQITRDISYGYTAKAFRGELVPTEAELARAEGREYETAEELLARIRSERAGSDLREITARLRGRRAKLRS